MLPDVPEKIHPIKFHSIDTESVKNAIVKTNVAIGPSTLDASGWKKTLTSKQFDNSSKDLCENIRLGDEDIYTTEDLLPLLEALLACRLILLGKNLGLRAIAIGKVLRCIASKVVVSHI